jgi:hypothetical protein
MTSSSALSFLKDRFNGVRVAPGDVIEPGRDKLLTDRFALGYCRASCRRLRIGSAVI